MSLSIYMHHRIDMMSHRRLELAKHKMQTCTQQHVYISAPSSASSEEIRKHSSF